MNCNRKFSFSNDSIICVPINSPLICMSQATRWKSAQVSAASQKWQSGWCENSWCLRSTNNLLAQTMSCEIHLLVSWWLVDTVSTSFPISNDDVRITIHLTTIEGFPMNLAVCRARTITHQMNNTRMLCATIIIADTVKMKLNEDEEFFPIFFRTVLCGQGQHLDRELQPQNKSQADRMWYRVQCTDYKWIGRRAK